MQSQQPNNSIDVKFLVMAPMGKQHTCTICFVYVFPDFFSMGYANYFIQIAWLSGLSWSQTCIAFQWIDNNTGKYIMDVSTYSITMYITDMYMYIA